MWFESKGSVGSVIVQIPAVAGNWHALVLLLHYSFAGGYPVLQAVAKGVECKFEPYSEPV